MAVPFLTIIVAAAAMGNPADGAQLAYNQCLANELDAALSHHVDSAGFAAGAARVCETETANYRRMAVAAMVGQGVGGSSPLVASQRFDRFDRDNRAELINTFENRMRLRRGPSRVAGLPENQQQD